MEPFTLTQWVIVLLVFLLGIVLGMFLFASPKWKRRYRDEAARRQELEVENQRLNREHREYESLRHAAAKTPPADPTVRGPL